MREIIENHLNDHFNLSQKMFDLEPDIQNIANLLIDSLKNGKTIFWCGNGGSASDSQHLAGELIGRFHGDRIPLKSISLNADSAVMTCIVNDYGYEHIFSRQIQGLGSDGDVLIGISTSGNSENVINAFKSAKKIGVKTIGFLGNKGGRALDYVDHSIIIPSTITARIQEMHILIGHILCDLIEEGLHLKA